MLFGAVVALGIAFSPWLWLIALFALLRGIPTALARPLLVAHLARVVPRSHQTGVFGLFPTVGNVGGLIFPLLAASVVGSGLWAAFAIGSLGYAASVVSGVKLGRVPHARRSAGQRRTAEASTRPRDGPDDERRHHVGVDASQVAGRPPLIRWMRSSADRRDPGLEVSDVVALVSTLDPRLPRPALRLPAQLRRQGTLAQRHLDAGPAVRGDPRADAAGALDPAASPRGLALARACVERSELGPGHRTARRRRSTVDRDLDVRSASRPSWSTRERCVPRQSRTAGPPA